MPVLFFIIAGIILIANSGWFHGADIVGIVLLVFGGLGLVLWLVAAKFARSIIKEVKGPGTPRHPRRFR
jgi:hypothetical protein